MGSDLHADVRASRQRSKITDLVLCRSARLDEMAQHASCRRSRVLRFYPCSFQRLTRVVKQPLRDASSSGQVSGRFPMHHGVQAIQEIFLQPLECGALLPRRHVLIGIGVREVESCRGFS